MRLPRWAASLAKPCAALLAAACFAPPLRAQLPGAYEQGLYDLRIGRSAGVTSPVLVTPRGGVLVPVDRVVALSGLPESIDRGDSVRSTPVVGTNRMAVLDLRARHVLREGEVHPIGDDEAAIVDAQIYLAPSLLAEWLGGRVLEDRENLVITFTRTPPFPVEQQLTTRERRAAYAARAAGVDSARVAVPWTPRTGGIAAEWNLSLPSAEPARNGALQLQLGGALLGGGFQAGSTVSGRRGLDTEELSRSWRYAYVNPLSAVVRSVEVGNLGTGTSYRAIRGIAISNVQPFRNGFFASVPVIPDVPSGWSYEIYQNGVLLGFSDGARQTAVPVPLYYGSTPVELRFLGPAGEEVTRSFVYQVAGQQLPPGDFEYSVGGGACPAAVSCRRVTYANAAYGIRSWVTLSAGGELVDSVGRHRYPYARALFATPKGYNGRIELTPQIKSASVTFLGLGRLAASASIGEIAAGAAIASFVDVGKSRRFFEPSVVVPMPERALGVRALRLETRIEQPAGRPVDRIRAVLSADLPRGQYGLQYDRDPLQRLGLVSATGTALVPVRARRWNALLPVQSDIGITRRGLQRVSLGTTLGNGQNRSVSATVRWLRPERGFSLAISYNAFLGRFRQSAAVFATPKTAIATTVLGGTAVFDRRHGLAQSDRFGINTAGVTGRVFFDEDADGTFSTGDRPAAGARIITDAGATVTDSDGRYRVWGLLSYEPTRIAVDTLQGIDLAYAPARPEARFRPTPNLYNPVDIPLLRTREIFGRVEGWAEMLAGGIGLTLRDVATGRVREVVTFNDGEFYVSRVPPGTYELGIAETSLRALRAHLGTAMEPLVVDGSSPEVVELPPIKIVRNQRDQREPSSP